MTHKTEVTWNQAIQIQKENEEEQANQIEEHLELVEQAYNWFMDNIETDPERSFLYFNDACEMYGIDSEDLEKRLL